MKKTISIYVRTDTSEHPLDSSHKLERTLPALKGL